MRNRSFVENVERGPKDSGDKNRNNTFRATMVRAIFIFLVGSSSGMYGFAACQFGWPPVESLRAIKKQFVRDNPYATAKVEIFRSSEITSKIIMLGDSHTEYGPWTELIPDHGVLNRGISGDTSFGVLARIDEIVQRKPKIVFLMIGINDIVQGVEADTIFINIKDTVAILKQAAISVWLQAIVHRSDSVRNVRKEVSDLNVMLAALAREQDIGFLNMNDEFAPSDNLKDKYTWDGAHLTGSAYLRWAHEIHKIIHDVSGVH